MSTHPRVVAVSLMLAALASSCGGDAPNSATDQAGGSAPAGAVASDAAPAGTASATDVSTGDQREGSSTPLPDSAADGMRFMYLSAPLADPNYGAVACGARIEAQRLGADLEHQESQDFSAAGQIPTLNAAVASQPDGLLVTPTDPQGLVAPLAGTVEDGLPVVTAINELVDASGVNAEVAVDNRAAGRAAAEFLAVEAGGEEVSVAVLTFSAGGSLAADDEWRGFEEAIGAHDNITYLGPSFVESDAASSTEAMNAILAREPDLFGVFTAFGASAQGVLASTRQRGVDPLIVSGYAASTGEVVEAMRAGEVAAIVDFPFREAGGAAMETLARVVLGEPVEERAVFDSVLYTRDSFDDPEQAANLGAECPQ